MILATSPLKQPNDLISCRTSFSNEGARGQGSDKQRESEHEHEAGRAAQQVGQRPVHPQLKLLGGEKAARGGRERKSGR